MANDILWLEQQEKELEAKLNVVRAALALYRSTNNINTPIVPINTTQKVIPPTKPVSLLTAREHVLNFLKGYGRCATSAQIADAIRGFYPDKNPNQLLTAVTGGLTEAKKRDEVVGYPLSANRTHGNGWGLPEWIGDNGRPKEGYEVI